MASKGKAGRREIGTVDKRHIKDPVMIAAEGFRHYERRNRFPDQRRRHAQVYGQKTRLGFCEFVTSLFHLNEASDWRRTDADLRTMILDEFSHSASTLRSFEDGNQTIAKLRNEFNRAANQPKDFPPENPGKASVMSIRYGRDGMPVQYSSPHKSISKLELLAHYDYIQKKWGTIAESKADLEKRLSAIYKAKKNGG